MSSSGGRAGRGAAEGAGEGRADGVRAIVAGHGELAAGLVSAVAQITGRSAALVPLSNRGLGAASLEERLREEVEQGARIIFTDLPGGSWTLAARRLMRDRPEVVLVTGVNLAALLDFVMRTDPPSEMADHAADKGRASIGVTGGGTARGH